MGKRDSWRGDWRRRLTWSGSDVCGEWLFRIFVDWYEIHIRGLKSSLVLSFGIRN